MITLRAQKWVMPEIELRVESRGQVRYLSLLNHSSEPVKVHEITVFRAEIPYAPDTAVYGEGATKLSQYTGTLSQLGAIGSYNDFDHYKLPRTPGYLTCFNMMMLHPANAPAELLGFASCRRFHGKFNFNPAELEVILNCEGITIRPGGELALEEFFQAVHKDREELLKNFAEALNRSHPRLNYDELVTGWCSWSCYGPEVTEKDIMTTLEAAREKVPELRFIQIDDGYQTYMGDWLDSKDCFGAGVGALCRRIKAAGFEPAIWVAPFIAEKDSKLFREHPDWFVRGIDGQPLNSGDCSFGGWRCGPWYMLDGSHPGAQEYLRKVFHTMRHEWQCKYFKLDANFWGAMPFGQRFAPETTSVEAYRQGMRAILEGAGEDSLLLGCNAPLWPSLGTCHAMRVSDDIGRRPKQIKILAAECFRRNWQHDRLWINDPDCILLENLKKEFVVLDGKQIIKEATEVKDNEFAFHLAHILASGRMILSGDRICDIGAESVATLKKLLSGVRPAARFGSNDFSHGVIEEPDGRIHLFFNWHDYTATDFLIPELAGTNLVDFWTGETFDGSSGKLTLKPFSAKVLKEV